MIYNPCWELWRKLWWMFKCCNRSQRAYLVHLSKAPACEEESLHKLDTDTAILEQVFSSLQLQCLHSTRSLKLCNRIKTTSAPFLSGLLTFREKKEKASHSINGLMIKSLNKILISNQSNIYVTVQSWTFVMSYIFPILVKEKTSIMAKGQHSLQIIWFRYIRLVI